MRTLLPFVAVVFTVACAAGDGTATDDTDAAVDDTVLTGTLGELGEL